MTTYNILLIEDDPGIAGSLQTALVREGYTVHWNDRRAGRCTPMRATITRI